MTDEEEDQREIPIQTALRARDFERATRLTLELYGAGVLRFLVARLRNVDDAREAYAMFAEDLWSSITRFEFRCTMRGWAYVLARNAAHRHLRSPQRRACHNEPISAHASALADPGSVRSATAPHQRTALKQRIRALRAQLAAEDQVILTLHVDGGLPFRELALVLQEPGAELHGSALTRSAARLRKRFERLKRELRTLAEAEGLLSGELDHEPPD
jgi:RNA polymerase sigma-70 factor, ECF subfamily